MNKEEKDEQIESLLGEYKEQRDALKEMVQDLEKLKEKIDRIFPDKVADYKVMRYFEEKVKAATALFNAILDVRKELNRSVKDEIEVRRKLDGKSIDMDEAFGKLIDVRKIAKEVEDMNKKVDNMKKQEED